MITSDRHVRCLGRVAEAVEKCGFKVVSEDTVVCVQGDEPLLGPSMIEATIKPLFE